jgi:uncharacterized membrane protein HdeD (DUF308 family)
MVERDFNAAFPLNEAMIAVLAHNWWAIAIRGVLGILFGLVALFLPGATMLSLIWLFSLYLLFDGIFGIVSSIRAATHKERWGLLLVEGIVDIATAAIAFLWPGITVLAFVFLVGAWAILSGALMLSAAFQVAFDGRWWLGLGGVISIIYGFVLFIAPAIGALVLTWWLGAYAVVFGASLIAFAFRLRGLQDKHPIESAGARKLA